MLTIDAVLLLSILGSPYSDALNAPTVGQLRTKCMELYNGGDKQGLLNAVKHYKLDVALPWTVLAFRNGRWVTSTDTPHNILRSLPQLHRDDRIVQVAHE